MPFGRTRVVMTKSVEQYEAGRKYWLGSALADTWILRGYCEGRLSRAYTQEEETDVRRHVQSVRVP